MKKLLFFFICLLFAIPSQARTIIVDANGSADFNNIQAAIDDSNDGDVIEVRPGTYTGPGNRDIDFGGLAVTIRSTDPNDPNIVAATIIDCNGSSSNKHRGFKFVSAEGPNSVLAGLTITGGFAPNDRGGGIYCYASSPTITHCTITGNTSGEYGYTDMALGGGVYCESTSNMRVTNCAITSNIVEGGYYGTCEGGGLYFKSDCNVTISNCTITDNRAYEGGGVYGGGSGEVVIEGCTIVGNGATGLTGYGFGGGLSSCAGEISNCTINNNWAAGGFIGGGGGLVCCDADIKNCSISNNSAADSWSDCGFGGGLYLCHGNITNCTINGNEALGLMWDEGGGLEECNGTITNCTITNNSAAYLGGGLCYCNGITITNCTIAGNSAGLNYSGLANCDGTIRSSIIWGNYGASVIGSSNLDATYSDIEGGWHGTGNIDADPCFIAGPLGEYYLSQTAAGQVSNSPCVDAGSDTAANLGMDTFTTRTDYLRDKGVVDMGYHYPKGMLVDIGADGRIDLVDYAILAAGWLLCNDPFDSNCIEGPLPGDITRDYYIDMDDIAVLSDYWLVCCVTSASHCGPAAGATGVDLSVVLSWLPGEYAVLHDVYFGTDYNDVSDATPDSAEYMGNQEPNSWDPNDYDSNGLDLETTYYWRIDEVSRRCMAKGDVWSFTTLGEPNSHLVGWWKFDEGEGSTAYDSAGDNDGTIYGATWTAGQISGALSFDGDGDYINVPDSDSLDCLVGSNERTLSAWVKVNTWATDKGIWSAGSKSTHADFSLEVESTEGSLTLNLWYDDLHFTIPSNYYGWHLITVVYNGTDTLGYVDAAFRNSETVTLNTSDTDFHIGHSLSHDTYFNGIIDDVRIYDRALSAGEIEQLYQDGLN